MNISKLAIATGLTSAIALGAFIESADAQVRRRRGNTYSPTASNEASATEQFSLVDATPDNTLIKDEYLLDPNIGLFVGAIEDYALSKGGFLTRDGISDPGDSSFNPNRRYVYDSSGFAVESTDNPVTPVTEPFDGDLLVELFAPGEDPLFPTNNKATFGYTIINPETSQPVSTYRLSLENTREVKFNGYLEIPNFNQDEAVNSLSYILDNNLLGRTNRVRFVPEIEIQNQNGNISSVSTLDEYYQYQTNLTEYVPDLAGGNIIVRGEIAPVPESGTILGTLAALATGALIKRMKQH